MGRAPIDAYVFDCGRVITFDQDGAAVARMASVLGADTGTFGGIYAQERVDYDRGTLSAGEYWERVGLRFGATVTADTLARLIELDMASWFNINPAVVAIIASLRPRAPRMLVLSNMNIEGKHHLLGPARFCGPVDWTALFDRLLLSCDLGMVKPEPGIFEACVEAAGADPARCLLIDDTRVNVEAARAAGMHAVHFTDADSLAAILASDFTPGDGHS